MPITKARPVHGMIGQQSTIDPKRNLPTPDDTRNFQLICSLLLQGCRLRFSARQNQLIFALAC